MTGVMCAIVGGLSWTSNTQTIVVGNSGSDYGYQQGSYGSVAPGPIPLFTNALLVAAYEFYVGAPINSYFQVINVQGNQTGASWTSITIGGVTVPKASWTIGYSSPVTVFQASSASSLFGTTIGAQIPVVFA